MDPQDLNSPLAGMADAHGLTLRRRLYVVAALAELGREHGYEQVEVPLVERSTSFAEEVVGRSPWPEWDARGCFYLTVPDYKGSYADPPAQTEALLIPEGTISVTRWLGRLLSDNPNLRFPIKLFYSTPCFRNELLDELDGLKRRQFTQFGMEVLGAPTSIADIEIIHLIAVSLRTLGVSIRSIRVRIGDVAIFNRLVEVSGLGVDRAIELKEALDAIAECKAGKLPERRPTLVEVVAQVLDRADVEQRWRKVWLDLAGSRLPLSVLEAVEDDLIADRLIKLRELAGVLTELDVIVDIDPCVVRSHEYYTGIVFEIDVAAGSEVFVEVGGGGRYDRLVKHFVAQGAVDSIPATGFAFGVERLVELLDHLKLLGSERRVITSIGLQEASADLLVVPPGSMRGYVSATHVAASERAAGRGVDIYLGEFDGWRAYAAARGIRETRTLPVPGGH